MIALLASVLFATNATQQAFFPTNATARELVATCRAMIPANVELSGRLVMRNRRGVVKAEHSYVLTRTNALTRLAVDGQPFDLAKADPTGSLLGTDVTVSDLTLEYLWWDDVARDESREGDVIGGLACSVVVMRKGKRSVRVWISRKMGALMQAEETDGERTVRRLWGTVVKKFGDRWMAKCLEVETAGSGHRTKITVEELK